MKLSTENYNSILSMLNSTDKENMVVGFTCIEEANFKKNICPILFLFKDSQAAGPDWAEHAPKTYKKIQKITNRKDTFVTFKMIFDAMTIDNTPATQDIEFYIQRYTDFLINMVNSAGRFPQIEKLQIKLKDLEHESNSHRAASKD